MTRLAPKMLEVPNVEFAYENEDCMALELEVQLGPDLSKSTLSTLTFRTGNLSGYPIKVSVQDSVYQNWQAPVEVGAVSIQFEGSYERDILIAALQRIGLMTVPVYGKMERGPFEPYEEPEDAIRQQTPPL
jgi:hypothetical protein